MPGDRPEAGIRTRFVPLIRSTCCRVCKRPCRFLSSTVAAAAASDGSPYSISNSISVLLDGCPERDRRMHIAFQLHSRHPAKTVSPVGIHLFQPVIVPRIGCCGFVCKPIAPLLWRSTCSVYGTNGFEGIRVCRMLYVKQGISPLGLRFPSQDYVFAGGSARNRRGCLPSTSQTPKGSNANIPGRLARGIFPALDPGAMPRVTGVRPLRGLHVSAQKIYSRFRQCRIFATPFFRRTAPALHSVSTPPEQTDEATIAIGRLSEL